MTNEYSGECIVGLMNQADKNLARQQRYDDWITVDVGGGSKVSVGPETIESFRRIAALKQHAIANGKPLAMGYASAKMKAVAKATGFPDLFD